MKKFTKLFLTFALLFGVMGGVNSVKAEKMFVDLSALSNLTKFSIYFIK